MTKQEAIEYYKGVRYEARKEIKRLKRVLALLEEQFTKDTKAHNHRKAGLWGYTIRIINDKIINFDAVIKTHRWNFGKTKND